MTKRGFDRLRDAVHELEWWVRYGSFKYLWYVLKKRMERWRRDCEIDRRIRARRRARDPIDWGALFFAGVSSFALAFSFIVIGLITSDLEEIQSRQQEKSRQQEMSEPSIKVTEPPLGCYGTEEGDLVSVPCANPYAVKMGH